VVFSIFVLTIKRFLQEHSMQRRSAVAIAILIASEIPAGEHVARPVAGGYTAADLSGERCQEQAALAFRAGDAASAAQLWEQALAIAEQHFDRGDPRLAASLTNQALVMRRRRQDYQAQRLFADALMAWGETWLWIHLMTPQPAGGADGAERSNRLEIYDPAARAAFTALAERGRAATAWLERYDQLPAGGLAEWLQIKPRRLTDLRKLLAAVLLIAAKPV
jgi:hypothetical protein